MTSVEVLDPWFEKVVKDVLGLESLKRFHDGAIPVDLMKGTALLRLGAGPAGIPRVWLNAPLLKDVEATPDLFEKLNHLNRGTDYLRFYWSEGIVNADADFVAESLRPEDLNAAFLAVDFYAGELGRLLELPDAKPWRDDEDAPDGAEDASRGGDVERELASSTNDAAHLTVSSRYLPDDHSPAEGATDVSLGYL